MIDRVMVRKSWNRTLMVTVRPATRRPAAGRPPSRRGGRARAAGCRGCGGRGRRSPRGRSTWRAGAGTTSRSSMPIDSRRRWAPLAAPERGDRRALVERGQVAHGVDAEPLQLLEGLRARRPTGPAPGAGAGRRGPRPASTTFTPSPGSGPRAADAGLGRLRRQLGHELRRRHAHRAREPLLVQHRGPDLGADRGAVAVEPPGAGDVEEGLVERDRLDERREGREDRHHAAG